MKIGSGIFLGGFLVLGLQAGLNAVAERPLDDTDSPTGQRSNMELLTDHGTGCQYLRVMGGGVTPRLDGAGRQMCAQKGGNQ